MHSILIVDDELSIRESFSLILEGKYRLLLAASGEAALKTISDQKADLAYLDIRMPGIDGLETLKRLKEIDPELEVIMVTAVNDVRNASEAIKRGARDYVVKPFDIEHITKLTEQILRRKGLLEQGSAVKKKAGQTTPELIGQTEKIAAISQAIENIKPDQRVLLVGELGTEKETVARIIHNRSPRAGSPFKTIAISPDRSAARLKSSVLDEAQEGTVFIDNLQVLPKDILKALTTKSARLIGGAREKIDSFSEVSLDLPPLRERSSDVPLLINHFIEKFSRQYNKGVKVEPKAAEVMAAYSWPGNVLQLQIQLEQLILCCKKGLITLADLPFDILLESRQNCGGDFLANFEHRYIQTVLRTKGKDKQKAASFLGIIPAVLESKLK